MTEEAGPRRWPSVLCAVLSWFLLATAVPPFGWTAMALCGGVPWLVWLRTRPERGFLLAWLAGTFVYGVVHLQWVKGLPGWAGPVSLVLLAATFTVLILPCAWFIRRLVVRRRLSMLVYVPLVFTTHDFLRERLVGGISWDTLGYGFADWTWLIQVCEHVRVWPLTLLAWASNAALAELWCAWRVAGERPRRRRAVVQVAGVAIVAVALVAWGRGRANEVQASLTDGPLVVGVQTNVAQGERQRADLKGREAIWKRNLETIARATEPLDDVALIVWPETSFLHSVDDSSVEPRRRRGPKLDLLLNGVRSNRRSIVKEFEDASHRRDPKRRVPRWIIGASTWSDLADGVPDDMGDGRMNRNSAILLEQRGRELVAVDAYHKRKLVPGGEYLPFRWLPGREALMEKIDELVHFKPAMTPGDGPGRFELPVDGRTWRFDVNICFEVVYPDVFRRAAEDGNDFVVNISNDNWFGVSAELDHVHRHMKYRAVECRRSIFRVSNTGISALIDPVGREVAVVQKAGQRKGIEGALVSRIPVREAAEGEGVPTDSLAWLTVAATALAVLRGLTLKGRD